ncbi:MAG TPA: DUF6266 family protein [Chitinophagaceae bacterium]
MAKHPFGILGPFFGKVGTVTGYTWKKIPVMRALPRKTNKKRSPAQVNQQQKMAFVTRVLKGLSNFIRIGFKEEATAMTEFNKAISCNMSHAVSGASPDFKLHYDLVAVSRGSLPNAVLPEAKPEGAAIRFCWADNSGIGKAAATDKAIVAVYRPDINSWYTLVSDVRRTDASVLFQLPGNEGKPFHTWLSFVSEEGETACSAYTGEVAMA